MRALIVAGFLGLCSAPALAQTPGFWLTGLAQGGEWGQATALSQDGTVAAGFSHGPSFGGIGAPGFTWTVTGGRHDFGFEPGMPPYTAAHGLSSTGNVVVGTMRDSPSTNVSAYRRVGNGPLESLGTLPNHHNNPPNEAAYSFAAGVSGDGNVVVGRSEAWWGMSQPTELVDQQAFRWTPQTGIQPLGQLWPGSWTRATAISRDGSTIVGTNHFGIDQAVTWRQGTGVSALPSLPGAPSLASRAEGISADGNVIVGRGSNAAGQSVAVRWTSAGPEDLGVLPGQLRSLAFAVSDGGDVVGGTSDQTAFVWTPATGMVTFIDYLALFNITVPPSVLPEYVYAISGDGLTFAGEARVDGVRQGFVATVPAPAGMLVVFAPALLALRRRRASA